MNHLKFRAWNKSHKVMLNNIDLFDLIRKEPGTINYKKYYEDNIILRYTGLNDKNGREIYEGDIVRYKSWADIIESEISFDPFAGWIGLQDIVFADSEYEVIGNIYETGI